MRIVGLDLSLTATGIADENGTQVVTTKQTGMARLQILRDTIDAVCSPLPSNTADLVVLEGYSMGTARQASHAHGLGELGGVIRLALYEAGIPFVDVAPACLKKFATGKGNAPKDAVLTAAVRAGFDGDNNNAADAWWLRQMALYAKCHAEAPIGWLHDTRHTLFRDEATAKVDWPTLTEKEVA